MYICKNRSADMNLYDSLQKEPGRRPKVGPLHCQSISHPIAISHPKEPRKSSWVPLLNTSVNLIDLPEDKNSLSPCSSEMHSRCSSSGPCHSVLVPR